MATELKPFEMAERLLKAAAKKGINSPASLYEAMKAAGYSVTAGGLKTIWYGQSVPNTTNAAAICEFLEITIDWYCLGIAPQPAGIDELERFWRTMAAKWGYDETRTLDTERAGIVELIQNMNDDQIKLYKTYGEGLLAGQRKG